MFKKQESSLSDAIGGAAIGIAVGMIMEKVLSPRTPVANSSTYGMHSPVQWQSGSNQFPYVPNPLYCHRVYPSPCKHQKQKCCNNSLRSEYEDSYTNYNTNSSQSSRIHDASTDEYTTSSKIFPHIPYDCTTTTSYKTRISNNIASSNKTEDSSAKTNKSNTTFTKKQDSSQSRADASKKQSIRDKYLESKLSLSNKQHIKKDLTIPAYKQKVNRVNESSVRNCGCPKRKIDKAHTDLPRKDKVPLFERSSKSKTIHCSKNESDTLRPKSSASTRSEGVKESANTSELMKSLPDSSTESSKSETLVKSSKEKTNSEESKRHGIKSSTVLDTSFFSHTKDRKVSETGNLATYHLTDYVDLDFMKTERSYSNIQHEKENVRDLLEFW